MRTHTIRTLRPDDAAPLLAFEQANRAWFERHIDRRPDDFYSIDGIHAHVAQFLDQHAQGRMHPCVIVGEHGELIGRANLKDIDRQQGVAEVGYRIGEQQAGKGLATAALHHLIALAQDEWQLQRLCACAIDGNAASIRVLERCGFVQGMAVPDIAIVEGTAVDGHAYALELRAAPQRIVVIGAGIVGASLAYHLASKGAKVTVVEAGGIASGVTGTSFAWINTSCAGPDPIAALRGGAIAAWRQLETQVPGLTLRWHGALSYGTQDGRVSPESILIDRARIAQLEPHLRQPPQQAVYEPEQGALDAVAATHALLAAARALGATVRTHTPVLGFTILDAKVTGVETATGVIEADLIVLAAGTGTAALAQKLGGSLPIHASPAIFLRYQAPPGLVRGIISSHAMEVRQAEDGTILAAEDYVDDAPENQPAAIALRTASAIREELEGAEAIASAFAGIGLRPMPIDGVPVIGYLPQVAGAYVCAMHPGVVLAAIVGELASEEIVDGTPASALAACRPARFPA
ncbi:FAD-dependent oxidoreductase [Janthinobacterium sp. PSPC1-1]|uniref:FAD-dependent oxidoreductase n=1 Tax=Janthinobacterium sp. PSPC1-1 TaxID=2804581 RepID=UPI003CED01C3